jgi:hypothetical protein
LLFAVADGKSPLPKPLKGATLVAKPPVSGGFGLRGAAVSDIGYV